MTASELKHRLLRVVGVSIPASAPAYIVDDVVQAVNHAYQVLWQDVPRERRAAYTRRIEQTTIPLGQNSVTLDKAIQSVLPPVRVLPLSTPLMVANHKTEVENHGLIIGNATGETTNSVPVVYYLDRLHQEKSDAILLRVIVAPTPSVETEITFEAEVYAPSFSAEQFCSATPPPLRIPHDYAESVLYPIAAFHLATQSQWFTKPESLPGIEAEYERAKLRAGISDPATTAATSSTKPADR